MKTNEPRSHIAAVDDEKSIQGVDTRASIHRDWRSQMTRLARWRAESQKNLTAASVSAALGLPALRCFVSRVLLTRIVLSNEVGTLAAVLIYHPWLKWDSIHALSFRRIFENGLVLKLRFLLNTINLALTQNQHHEDTINILSVPN